MTLHDTKIARLDGTPSTLGEITGGNPALLVNVASKCGLTPQYAQLEQLQENFADRGFTVVGVPCNQFGGQEPGTSEEIAAFCSATYGVTFPMTEKVDVNGANRHPLYDALVDVADEKGHTGDITWNFEKFLLDGDGRVVARWNPSVDPLDPRVTAAVESVIS
jgi:glutathione peroxidase